MPKKIEISHKTIIFTVVFLILVWFFYYIRDIILTFFISIIVMAILNPTVTKLTKYNIPRSLSVLLVYLLLLAVAGISTAAIIPSLVEQTTNFINNLPRFISNIGVSSVLSDQIIQQLVAQLGALPVRVSKVVLSLFSNVISIATILVFAFYLLSDREKLDNQLSSLFDKRRAKEVAGFIDLLEKKLGGWARAEISLMISIGVATYIGLKLLGVPFALPLAILAGLLEIIPYVGPVIAAVPAVIIGFGISPIIGLAVTALAFLVQQLENYVLVPKLMQKSAGVNPIVTLLSLAIGFRLAGILGLIISVPVFITIQTFIKNYFSTKS